MIFNTEQDTIVRETLRDLPSQEEIRHLPQFFRADLDMVYRWGGPFLRRFLGSLPLRGLSKYVSIDSRSHMLMPSWYPCIPGWHCDDFHRPTGKQPDFVNIRDAWSTHHMMVVGLTSMTQFVKDAIRIDVETAGLEPIYKRMNQIVETTRPKIFSAQSGQIITFSPLSIHRGVAAEAQGWRYFIRVTESDHWEPYNEIRTQTQVYIPDLGLGW